MSCYNCLLPRQQIASVSFVLLLPLRPCPFANLLSLIWPSRGRARPIRSLPVSPGLHAFLTAQLSAPEWCYNFTRYFFPFGYLRVAASGLFFVSVACDTFPILLWNPPSPPSWCRIWWWTNFGMRQRWGDEIGWAWRKDGSRDSGMSGNSRNTLGIIEIYRYDTPYDFTWVGVLRKSCDILFWTVVLTFTQIICWENF